MLDHQNNYVECLNADHKDIKKFNILITILSIFHNYFDVLNKIIFRSVSS